MKASDVIATIQTIMELRGDVRVYIECSDPHHSGYVTSVYIDHGDICIRNET